MLGLLATQDTGAILGPIAKILGVIMNAIFNLMDSLFGIQNIGLSIILFTVVVYMCMLPLTYKQQKFSKMSVKMNPEIKAIQKKYAGKQDQASMMAMNEESKAVYAKYGVSPSGSCLQLIIQMPILFALYRVIYNVPAYITSVKESFMPLVNKLLTMDGAVEYMTEVGNGLGFRANKVDFTQANAFVDVLNKFQASHWTDLSAKYPELSDLILNTQTEIEQMNTFLGINIAYSPSNLLKTGSVVLMIGAIAIPALAALTQWLNTKLMPQAGSSDDGKEDTMSNTMKQMNVMMPLMSAIFCFTLPAGMGIYWIASALVRCIQQIILNKHFDKVDLDELVKKNLEKLNEKRAKEGLPPARLNEKAIREAQVKPIDAEKAAAKRAATQESIKKSTAYYNDNAKPGSLAAKANMVKKFDEKNAKK